MGAVSVDTQKKGRNNEQKYPLTTKEGVERFLTELPKIKESRFFRADMSASDMLMDIELALKKADLSAKQAEVIQLIFLQDLTLTEAGARMEIGASMVSKHRDRALEKIATVFQMWGYDNDLQF